MPGIRQRWNVLCWIARTTWLAALTAGIFCSIRAAYGADPPLPPGAILRLGSAHLTVEGEVLAVAISPNNKLIAAGFKSVHSLESIVRVWNLEDGSKLGDFREDHRLTFLSFSNDSETLLTSSHRYVLKTREDIVLRPVNARHVVASTRDLLAFTTSTKGELALLDLARPNAELHFELRVQTNGVTATAFSSDAKLVAVGTYDGQLQIRDCATGKLVHELALPQKNMVASVDFSPDGRWLVACGYLGTLPVYEVATGKLAKQLSVSHENLAGPPRVVRFTRDGRQVVVGFRDDGLVRIWDFATKRQVRAITSAVDEVKALEISQDGTLLAVGGRSRSGQKNLGLYNLASGEPKFKPQAPDSIISRVVYSPDGRQIVTAARGGRNHVWDTSTGKQHMELEGGAYGSLSYSSDGWLLGAIDNRGTCRLWEADSGDLVLSRDLQKQGEVIRSGAISPRLDLAVVGTQNGGIRAIHIPTGNEVQSFVAYEGFAEIPAVAVSPDSRWIASAAQQHSVTTHNSVDLWDCKTGERRSQFAISFEDSRSDLTRGIHELRFSDDGTLLLASHITSRVFVWDTHSGILLQEIPSSQNRYGLTRDGQLAILLHPEHLQVFELATGETMAEIKIITHPPAQQPRFNQPRLYSLFSTIAVAPDGRSAATPNMYDHTTLIWTLAPPGWNAQQAQEEMPPARLDALWASLALTDGPRAYRAIWTLAEQGDSAVAHLESRVKPTEAPRLDRKRIAQLIKALDSDDFQTRQKASRTLALQVRVAQPQLHEALEGTPSLEAKFRITQLLSQISGSNSARFTGERLQRIRTVQVLERIGTPRAAALLAKLATGHKEAYETRLAQSARLRVKSQLRSEP